MKTFWISLFIPQNMDSHLLIFLYCHFHYITHMYFYYWHRAVITYLYLGFIFCYLTTLNSLIFSSYISFYMHIYSFISWLFVISLLFPHINHIEKAPHFDRQWDDSGTAPISLKNLLPRQEGALWLRWAIMPPCGACSGSETETYDVLVCSWGNKGLYTEVSGQEVASDSHLKR